MAERNYMNVNEVYPILDLINRKIKQGVGVTHILDSPLLSDSPTPSSGSDTTVSPSGEWLVESFEVVRDTANQIDPSVISQVIIVYMNGAIDTISLTRGLVPGVPDTTPDAEYINNLMITSLAIETNFKGAYQTVAATIFKENGYGAFQKVELTYDYSEEVDETTGLPDPNEVDTENPNDFFDGSSANSYDPDVDTAEDYADTEYTEDDEPVPNESGWEDGFDPSSPNDVDLENSTELDGDYSEVGYDEHDETELEEGANQ